MADLLMCSPHPDLAILLQGQTQKKHWPVFNRRSCEQMLSSNSQEHGRSDKRDHSHPSHSSMGSMEGRTGAVPVGPRSGLRLQGRGHRAGHTCRPRVNVTQPTLSVDLRPWGQDGQCSLECSQAHQPAALLLPWRDGWCPLPLLHQHQPCPSPTVTFPVLTSCT